MAENENGASQHSEASGQTPERVDFPVAETGTDPDEFVEGVRRSIHRRAAGAQVVSIFWELPKVVVTEMAKMASGILDDAAKRG